MFMRSPACDWIYERLDREINTASQHDGLLAVLYMDIDRFRHIVDTFGHPFSDRLLDLAGQRLMAGIHKPYVHAPCAGDEFIIVLTDLRSEAEACDEAQRIIDHMAHAFVMDQVELFVTCSIGISMFPSDGTNGFELIRQANRAMYHAKDMGRNNAQLYRAVQELTNPGKAELMNDLHRAMIRREFFLHYQPIVNRDNRIIGTEALVRWRHPTRGVVSPAEFVPLAEETGLIIPLNEWILRAACLQNKAWQNAGFPEMFVAVNLSLLHFRHRHFVSTVRRILLETGLHPRFLELELTESIFAYDLEYTVKVLQELRELGVMISLDDFGTGFSSLSYLKRFPLEGLKIDKSFIQDVGIEAKDQAIVRAIIQLAYSLNLKVVAEGVETEEQWRFLHMQACDRFQGYLIGRPQSPETLSERLAASATEPSYIGGSYLWESYSKVSERN